MTHSPRKTLFLYTMLAIILSLALLMPQPVRAQDETPPTEVPTETNPAEGEATSEPTGEPATTEEPVLTEETTREPDIVETVEAMNEAGAMLVDENGEPIPLATEAGVEALTDPDPFIVRGGTTYSFTAADCDPVTAGAQPCANPIQAAIDFSVAGEVINIEPGTYQAQIFINKDITLQGTAPGVVIQSPTALANCYSTSTTNRAIVCVTGANNVSIRDVTVDGLDRGNGTTTYRFVGIGYFNAGGTIQGNTITNMMDSPFSGNQSGMGIYAYNADGASRTLYVLDNVVTDYQKGGITANGAGLTAIIDGNTVVGQGPTGIIAQNSIQIGFGATGIVSNNDVSGNDYTGSGWSSAGILLYDTTGNVLVEDNNVHDNQVGITLVGPDRPVDPYTPSLATITGNTITNNTWGVSIASYSVAGDANASVTGNIFDGNVSGVSSDNPNATVSGNTFDGNTSAVDYDNGWYAGPLIADGNYWGCPDGPGTPGCDTYSGNVLIHTYLAEDPFIPLPVEEPVAAPGVAGAARRAILPTTGGETFDISCDEPVTLVILNNTHRVEFKGLCGYQATIEEVPAGGLPGALPDGETYTAGLKISLFQNGNPVDVLPAGTSIVVDFLLQAGQMDDPFSVLFWNPEANSGAGAWAALPSLGEAAGLTALDPAANDGRNLFNGTWTTADGYVSTELNFTGTFVLVTP